LKLLVLAGGLGSRLKKTVPEVPKALAPICGVEFLQIQLAHWVDQGLREFTFLLHHQAEQIIVFLKAQQAGVLKGCQVDWLIEPVPMDTGGAITYAVKTHDLTGDILITNADTWLGGGILELILSSAPAIAVVNLADISRFGQVHFDHNQRVTAFVEKNAQCESGWINAGLYHLNTALFKDRECRPFSLERELFSELVQNRRLMAVPLQTDFIDIGVPNDYHRFCRWVKAGRQKPLCT
jgi:NDP-sugar pyrophosphorylase family protein